MTMANHAEYKNRASDEIKELSLLLDVNNKLSEALNIKKALRSVLQIIADHMEMLRGILTILDRSTGAIISEEVFGLLPQERAKAKYLPDKEITDAVIEMGLPAIISHISDKPLFLGKKRSNNLDKAKIAFICVPIKIDREVIGALAVDRLFNEEVPFEEDVRLLTSIASSVSHAVRWRQEASEELEELRLENQRLRAEIRVTYSSKNIIGNSQEMRNINELIDTASRSNITVLIIGESGVGKERVAKAIHCHSSRADESFIKVHCAALPESLIESDLFGYEKGAFAGATALHRGSFETADKGTLFLDEIGELPPVLQAKLVRFLKNREFERIGGNRTIKVDVRMIAATNQNLEELIREGKFSKDIFYQLNAFPIIVPPLHERKTDVILLADYFIEKYAKELGKEVTGISAAAIDMLMNHHWPGNVRELENCIERAIILSTDNMIHLHHMPPSLRGSRLTG